MIHANKDAARFHHIQFAHYCLWEAKQVADSIIYKGLLSLFSASFSSIVRRNVLAEPPH